MKKKTMKGLIIGLSTVAVVGAGLSAVSIATKGFTDYDSLKIKAPGEVVERFTWDEDKQTFVNENIQKLDEGTYLEEIVKVRNNFNFNKRSSVNEALGADGMSGFLSASEIEELYALCTFSSGNAYSASSFISSDYLMENYTTFWNYSEESKEGEEARGPGVTGIMKSSEYSYFNKVRINLIGVENDMIGLSYDGESWGYTEIYKTDSLRGSYLDLTLDSKVTIDFGFLLKADSKIQEEAISIESIELINTDSDVEDDAVTYLNWGVAVA